MVPPGRPDDLEALSHCHPRKRRDAGGQFLNLDFGVLLIRGMNAGYQNSVSGLVETCLVRVSHLYLISLPEWSAEKIAQRVVTSANRRKVISNAQNMGERELAISARQRSTQHPQDGS